MNWIEALKILGPAILAVVPGAQPFIPLVIGGIELAERSQKDGAEKKVIARDAVIIGAQTANTIAKREVVNETEAVQVYENTVDAVVGAVNLVKVAKQKPEITEGN